LSQFNKQKAQVLNHNQQSEQFTRPCESNNIEIRKNMKLTKIRKRAGKNYFKTVK
jgi:hypothetical protein